MCSNITLARLSAILGLVAIALGAFGAHAWKPLLEANHTLETFKTGAHYHLIHAVLLCLISWRGGPKAAWWCLALGTILFSGSLYLIAGPQWKFLGPITPLGGLLLLTGWLLLAVRPPLANTTKAA